MTSSVGHRIRQGLHRRLPILTWFPLYERARLRPDIGAGVVVAALAVPQSLGYASIAGVPVQVGLYAVPIALLVYARAGRSTVRTLIPVWLEERKHSVSAKTYVADAALVRLVPHSLAALRIAAVSDREVSRALIALSRTGLAEASVRRFRDLPKASSPRTEMYPFSEEDLEELYGRAVQRDQRLADILLVGAWTGLRWSELRAVRVRDFVEVPLPVLVVQRAEPEGVQVKGTKSGRSRRVPVADRVLPLVRSLAAGREADDLLCVTSSGHRLHASAFKRTLAWASIAQGRRIHDLRHTAACLWLARGVDPVTVQAWIGHASIATTNLSLHHLGTPADRAGLDRLNRRGHTGGTRSVVESE
jgi:integrase